MNIFKGALFLHDAFTSTDKVFAYQRRRYGAGSLASTLAPSLGNRAASNDWFGIDRRARSGHETPACTACHCA